MNTDTVTVEATFNVYNYFDDVEDATQYVHDVVYDALSKAFPDSETGKDKAVCFVDGTTQATHDFTRPYPS